MTHCRDINWGRNTCENWGILTKNKESILEFLWEDGKILVPMNSAEKFADIIIKTLDISEDRVTKFKVSTYKQWVSMKEELQDSDKHELSKQLGIKQWDRVFILEDLIDTGHTLRIIYEFLKELMVEVQALCLLDKHVSEGDKVKAEMWEKLKSIIDIGQEFVIGFGMDYEERLCADMFWLWKIKENSIPEVTKYLNVYVENIRHILERPDAP